MALRLKAMGPKKQPKYTNGFQLKIHQDELKTPPKWKKTRMVFVNSMSDLFHKDVPDWFILEVFDTMRNESQHTFQVLTKRSDRLLSLNPQLIWPSNVWMGVSIENANYMYRLDHLRQTGANIKFVSFEPLLGPIPTLNLTNISWIIVGGESGPKSRPIDPDWVRDIRDQCIAANVPFYFKQWGGVNKKKTGKMLDGRTWEDMP